MTLKTSIVTLVSFVLTLSASASWPQSPGAGPAPPGEGSSSDRPAHSSIFPDDIPGLQQLAVESYQSGDYLRFVQATIKLREKRPYNQEYLIGMVAGAALLGRNNTAYNYMHIMQQQGLSYDFNSTEDTKSIRKTEVYDYLNDLLVKAGEPMGQGRVAFTLPDASVQPESIAWDDSRGRFLVGTIESGAILAVTPGGEVQELLHSADDNGLLAITGIAVDQAHQRLWVSSAGVPGFSQVLPTELDRGALLEFDLKTLKLLQRYDVPVDGLPHVPGSVVVTPGGDVYLIDRAVQMVFRKLSGAKKLEVYLASSNFTGFRDIALSDAGDKLYLADAALGIAVVDLGTKASSMLSGPESLNFGGLSGVMYSEGHLFVLQSGIMPQRLMRLDLDAGGLSVTKATPLAVALEDFDRPSFGTIQGGTVYYFASGNTGEARTEPAPVKVLKTPTEPSEDIVPVEQRKYQADKLKRQAPSPLKPSPDSESGANPDSDP
jgi:hypothetical protein